jgi:hypothetical protein
MSEVARTSVPSAIADGLVGAICRGLGAVASGLLAALTLTPLSTM